MDEKPKEPPLRTWCVTSVRGTHIVRQPTEQAAVANYRGVFAVPDDVKVTAEPIPDAE